ncbi:hypothetical protein SCUP234_13436, partial [Seiridium cupressi]
MHPSAPPPTHCPPWPSPAKTTASHAQKPTSSPPPPASERARSPAGRNPNFGV